MTRIPEREREIARRFQEARLENHASRSYLGARLGVDSQLIARIELGRVPLRVDLAGKFCEELGVSQRWLATGVGEGDRYVALPAQLPAPPDLPKTKLFSEWYDKVLSLHCEAFYAIRGDAILRHIVHTTWYKRPVGQRGAGTAEEEAKVCLNAVRELMTYVLSVLPPSLFAWFFRSVSEACQAFISGHGLALKHWKTEQEPAREESLAPSAIGGEPIFAKHSPPSPGSGPAVMAPLPLVFASDTEQQLTTEVQSEMVPATMTWPELKADLQRFTELRGAKAALARYCAVTPQAVAKWLGNGSATEPGAEATLKLLEWVRAQKSAAKPRTAKAAPAAPASKVVKRARGKARPK